MNSVLCEWQNSLSYHNSNQNYLNRSLWGFGMQFVLSQDKSVKGNLNGGVFHLFRLTVQIKCVNVRMPCGTASFHLPTRLPEKARIFPWSHMQPLRASWAGDGKVSSLGAEKAPIKRSGSARGGCSLVGSLLGLTRFACFGTRANPRVEKAWL